MKKHAQLFFLSILYILSFSANSMSYVGDGTLAKQCFSISKQLGKIAAIQIKSKCRNNAANAALGVGLAAPELLIRDYRKARKRLAEAVNHLQSVEQSHCIKKNVLMNSKNKIIAIKDQVMH